jgi:hypothetical protein
MITVTKKIVLAALVGSITLPMKGDFDSTTSKPHMITAPAVYIAKTADSLSKSAPTTSYTTIIPGD